MAWSLRLSGESPWLKTKFTLLAMLATGNLGFLLTLGTFSVDLNQNRTNMERLCLESTCPDYLVKARVSILAVLSLTITILADYCSLVSGKANFLTLSVLILTSRNLTDYSHCLLERHIF